MCPADNWRKTAEIFDEFHNKPLNTAEGHELEEFAGFDTHLDVLIGVDRGSKGSRVGPGTPHHMDELGNRRVIHAAGLCKFATVPPARGIWIVGFSRSRWVYNPDGVTQWDVVGVIREA